MKEIDEEIDNEEYLSDFKGSLDDLDFIGIFGDLPEEVPGDRENAEFHSISQSSIEMAAQAARLFSDNDSPDSRDSVQESPLAADVMRLSAVACLNAEAANRNAAPADVIVAEAINREPEADQRTICQQALRILSKKMAPAALTSIISGLVIWLTTRKNGKHESDGADSTRFWIERAAYKDYWRDFGNEVAAEQYTIVQQIFMLKTFQFSFASEKPFIWDLATERANYLNQLKVSYKSTPDGPRSMYEYAANFVANGTAEGRAVDHLSFSETITVLIQALGQIKQDIINGN
jgi:hypothetical protein